MPRRLRVLVTAGGWFLLVGAKPLPDRHSEGGPHTLPITQGPEYHDIMPQAYLDYAPIIERRMAGELRVVRTLIPRKSKSHRPHGIVVVRAGEDKAHFQAVLQRDYPDLEYLERPGHPLLFTADQHLTVVRQNLAEARVWRVDLGSVKRRLQKDLKGVRAVFYYYEPADIPPYISRWERPSGN